MANFDPSQLTRRRSVVEQPQDPAILADPNRTAGVGDQLKDGTLVRSEQPGGRVEPCAEHQTVSACRQEAAVRHRLDSANLPVVSSQFDRLRRASRQVQNPAVAAANQEAAVASVLEIDDLRLETRALLDHIVGTGRSGAVAPTSGV